MINSGAMAQRHQPKGGLERPGDYAPIFGVSLGAEVVA